MMLVLETAQQAQVNIDIVKKVVASKDNPLDSKMTATAQHLIEVLERAIEEVFSQFDNAGPSILGSDDFTTFLKII